MINLILTPVYKNYEVLNQMCEAIDKFTNYPFMHILVDDNGNLNISKSNRRTLNVHSDVEGIPHKNQAGQCLQLAFDYAHYSYWNGDSQDNQFDHVFLIESDVIVRPSWDAKMIELSNKLPVDWGTLDCVSLDEQDNITYPSTVAPNLGKDEKTNCIIREYPEFQCTLFDNGLWQYRELKFSNFPSHFDILFGRKATELTGCKHYESLDIPVLHIKGGGNSRGML